MRERSEASDLAGEAYVIIRERILRGEVAIGQVISRRKIAVEWKALHFVPAASKRYGIVLELTRDQVKPAPEYKEGKPTVVLGASGNLEPLP